jgi:hypothetical protein
MIKCWNCGEEFDEEERIRKIEGERVCPECWEQHREEQREDHEADYWDRVIDERKGK